MTDYFMIYRNVEAKETFEKMEPPEFGARIRDQVIPSQAGVRPIYVRWHHRQFEQDTLHLVTYTHNELTDLQQMRGLTLRAAQFAWGEPGPDNSQLTSAAPPPFATRAALI